MSEAAKPWLASDGGDQAKRHAPATVRNRDVICEQLAAILPACGAVLEVASGSGEHIVHFARTFPALNWTPSDPETAALASIRAWAAETDLPNLAPPLQLDAAAPETWNVSRADAILCINMAHISPWAATLGLLRGAASLLPQDGALYLYGPFFRQGVETAPSNLAFDESLKARNPQWGLRWVEDVEAAALAEGLRLERITPMPANNLSVIFRRT